MYINYCPQISDRYGATIGINNVDKFCTKRKLNLDKPQGFLLHQTL